MRTWILRILAINLVVSGIWLGWPFLKSPEAQVRAQQGHLVDLVARRNWKEVFALMAGDYHDNWNMNREEAVSVAHELLQGFLILNLEWKPSSISLDGKTATVTGFIKAGGSGAGFSTEIINRVNNLREPFVFVWRKDGWKPGDWRLESIKQAGLE